MKTYPFWEKSDPAIVTIEVDVRYPSRVCAFLVLASRRGAAWRQDPFAIQYQFPDASYNFNDRAFKEMLIFQSIVDCSVHVEKYGRTVRDGIAQCGFRFNRDGQLLNAHFAAFKSLAADDAGTPGAVLGVFTYDRDRQPTVSPQPMGLSPSRPLPRHQQPDEGLRI